MSVSVHDILKLPCLREARVLAGKNGLQKEVSSITVLEFAEANDLQEDLFQKNEFYGSEIVITAFASIADNVDHQCANIRRMAAVGEVGLIIYYVGILLPRIDQRLIDLSDELDFALIVMPENRMDLRYSEAISEVMELIFRDQMSDQYFVSDILNRMCRLPEHQRKVDAVLRMISDRIRSSLILADHDHRHECAGPFRRHDRNGRHGPHCGAGHPEHRRCYEYDPQHRYFPSVHQLRRLLRHVPPGGDRNGHQRFQRDPP